MAEHRAMANYVDLDLLSASTLRHLAALREERDRARYIDYQAMAEELAVMLCEGRKPTIGWYQRRLRLFDPDAKLGPAKSALIPPDGRLSSFTEHHCQLFRHGQIVDVASPITFLA